jgi:arginyl-tRNA synthetase
MAGIRLPPIAKTRDSSNGDFTVILKGACARRKIDVVKYSNELTEALNAFLKENPKSYLRDSNAMNGYVNLFVNRSSIFEDTIKTVLGLGEKYGSSDKMAGQKVIIEHTSSNPNGPLHIGNLRNVMLGAHLSKLFEAVGYEVKQHFFVNDLGAQIGLTALGYSRIYSKVEPKLKIDQWIGMIYACMNTLSELQILGHTMGELLDVYENGSILAKSNLFPLREGESDPSEKKLNPRRDYLKTFDSLYERQPDLCVVLLREFLTLPSIKKASAELNLQYERNEASAVKIFRAMVNCLSGVQQTLDTYNVRHDSFDFESELGWEGSNDRVMERLKASPYFVPETQKNEKGVPEGGHILTANFIRDAKLPTGKKGYQKNFPNFYVLRPDGSTLYTFRDVVYSLKKCAQADHVFNIIASEQNLPQEKVALTMALLDPKAPRKLYHLSYELVKLSEDGKEVKMSGRRGRYVLADDLYVELRDAVIFYMKQKMEKTQQENPDKAPKFTEEELLATGGEVATASMKYALLSTPCRHEIKFDIQKVANPDEVSGPFLLYNAVRF